MKLPRYLGRLGRMFARRWVKALVGIALLIAALACGLSGKLSTFLMLPPLLLLGILWLARLAHRRLLGLVLIALLFVPTLGGPTIIFPFIPPLLFLTIPYLAIAVVFLLGKKPRKVVEAGLVLACVVLLLPGTPGPGYYLWVAGGLQHAMLSTFGNATLEVRVLAPDNSPVGNLEVDLWLAPTAGGPPDAGRRWTDASGVVTFRIIAGEYRIGFNKLNFPENYLSVEENVGLGAGERSQITVRLQFKVVGL